MWWTLRYAGWARGARGRWGCAGMVVATSAALVAAPPTSASLAPGTFLEHPTVAGSAPREIALAPGGNSVVFTEPGRGTLGQVSDKARYTRHYIVKANSGPDDITVGTDGDLWFTETATDRIARLAGGRITSYRLAAGSGPRGIAAGPDGALWFTEAGADGIGRITTAAKIRLFTLPTPHASPARIVAGPDGDLWFTEQTGGRIGRITTSGHITEYRIPAGAAPFGITAGPDGNMWFTLPKLNRIGVITPAGVITTFPILTRASAPRDITSAPDGAVWFTQPGANDIGRITPTGTVTEYPIPTPHARPFGIAIGIRGQIWFTEAGANKVGELAIAAPHTQYVTVGTGYVQQSPPRALPGTNVECTFFGPTTQTVTDATGMGLYDSGPRGFVSSFDYTFTAAGDYPYRSTTTGITETYKILPYAPRTGANGTPFTIRWASAAPAAGFSFDVRYRPPGASSYGTWQTTTTQRSAAFTPSATGRYVFEARLVDANTGPTTTSGWSPTVTVMVS